jgi:protein-tyrosine phosphatase
MIYSIFFLFISTICGYFALKNNLILLWPALNAFFFSLIYFLNKPKWFCKSKAGKLNPFILIFNLPWLAFTYLVWNIHIIISKENKTDKIIDTKIILGRRLLKNEMPSDVQIVLDLTSEFNEPKFENVEYINVPLLDSIQPNNTFKAELDSLANKLKDKVVLIHCAQGHGRTALATSILLVNLGFSENSEKAYKLILSTRPKAKMSKVQKKYLFGLSS